MVCGLWYGVGYAVDREVVVADVVGWVAMQQSVRWISASPLPTWRWFGGEELVCSRRFCSDQVEDMQRLECGVVAVEMGGADMGSPRVEMGRGDGHGIRDRGQRVCTSDGHPAPAVQMERSRWSGLGSLLLPIFVEISPPIPVSVLLPQYQASPACGM